MPRLPTAPRFLSRSACSRRGHYSPLRRKCRRASAGLFSGLRGSLCRGSRRLRASVLSRCAPSATGNCSSLRGATAFSPAGLAVSLLPGAPRFCVGAALVAARGRVWAPAPTSLYFLPSRIATHQGGPACPFKAIYLLSASAPWAGTSPAPTPRLQGAPAQKDTPQAMPAACPPLLPFFSSGCGRSPNPVRPSLSAPDPHRHRHGCRMPWRTLDPA